MKNKKTLELSKYLNDNLDNIGLYKNSNSELYKIAGIFNGQQFSIIFHESMFLILSTTLEGEIILEKLVETVTDFLGGESPIARYKILKESDRVERSMPTYEWNFSDKLYRLVDLQNNTAFNGFEIYDLQTIDFLYQPDPAKNKPKSKTKKNFK